MLRCISSAESHLYGGLRICGMCMVSKRCRLTTWLADIHETMNGHSRIAEMLRIIQTYNINEKGTGHLSSNNLRIYFTGHVTHKTNRYI